MTPVLHHMIRTGAIPHALLFVGSGGEPAARAFATELLGQKSKIASGNHPDLHIYHPEGKSGTHPIETLRRLSVEVAMRPNESRYKIFLIHDAERMPPTSGNALLKTLEEPSAQTVILLLTSHPDRLLPTLRSRCQIIEFQKVNKKERSEFHDRYLEWLLSSHPFEALEALSSAVEAKKKEWEKELKNEGAVALRYHELVISILSVPLQWCRDIEAVSAGLGPEKLYFPEHWERLKSCAPLSYPKIEEAVRKAHLALERTVKLSAVFESLALV